MITMIEAKEITLVDINKLKHYSFNRNKHPKDQIDRLALLIEKHGMRDPLTVDKDTMEVITGNGTLMACKKLKMKEVPVIFQSFETDEQRYAFSVSHNAINQWAEIDLSQIHIDLPDMSSFDLDLLGFKNFKFEPDVIAGCDEDEVPEHVEPKTRLGDLYILGNHRLLCGDSTNIQHVERLMNGEKADMVFTDPPYGISFKVGSYSKRQAKSVAEHAGIIMGDEGLSATKDAYRMIQALQIPTQIWWGASYYPSILEDGKKWIIWNKKHMNDTFSGFEFAYTNLEGKTDCFEHQWFGMIKGSEKQEKRVHPTQKPAALAEWCFDNYGKPQSVLDLFGGSGSTMIACEKTNRKCFMMELDPHYCDVIVARWEKYSGKKAVLNDGTTEIKDG